MISGKNSGGRNGTFSAFFYGRKEKVIVTTQLVKFREISRFKTSYCHIGDSTSGSDD